MQKKSMSEAVILFPHQLFREHPILKKNCTIYLVEEYLFFHQFNFHKIKLAYHRATMKCYENELAVIGLDVKYIDSNDSMCDIRELIPKLSSNGINKLHLINPTDNWLEKRINKLCKDEQIEIDEHENPLFISTREDLSTFFRADKKKFFQTSFYKSQRKKLNLLIDADGNPDGGKWTYDTENRKKYPKGMTPPTVAKPAITEHWKEAIEYVQKHFKNNPGELPTEPPYPIDLPESKKWFDDFLKHRFKDFGIYEDAIVHNETILNHSVLTPMMNVGLLSPQQIIKEVIKFASKNDIPINSLEGFIRQIIGWREFIRGMYEVKGSKSRTTNFWNFSRKIPASFYDGTTGIPPVDDTIKKVQQSAYCHHIERLMVIGNFMLLCEFDPDEVYRWFMELFIDAYDWVMVPNVYGMSQFADGGFFATKPYISSSNYILKMSNYKKGDWQKTWDGLFWRFMDKHRDFFLSNPRLGMLIRTYDKMDVGKQEAHLQNAEVFLKSL